MSATCPQHKCSFCLCCFDCIRRDILAEGAAQERARIVSLLRKPMWRVGHGKALCSLCGNVQPFDEREQPMKELADFFERGQHLKGGE